LAGQAGAAFSNPSTTDLARDSENTSLNRSAIGPAFRALREMKKLPRIGVQKKHGARPACRDGGVFEKTSGSLLARGLEKKPLHLRSE
jgi:transposase InsO family protein